MAFISFGLINATAVQASVIDKILSSIFYIIINIIIAKFFKCWILRLFPITDLFDIDFFVIILITDFCRKSI